MERNKYFLILIKKRHTLLNSLPQRFLIPIPTPFEAILRFLIPLTKTLQSDTKVVRSDKLSLIPVCISARTDLISHISDNLSARRVKISLRTDSLSLRSDTLLARTTFGWGRPHLYMG